ncbi:carbon-nitrogen hydrolase family protein [Mycolicibacterium fluoranthenivorans]|uniref:Predicted amidohydrolase n=1 Tax=Mycolicibacterium fluoranthenivorans TaxID=258505 RepID=A0A1G4WYF9_9MYCO|nr:carbon-nitrogen hydrolase family protein [Mycolicibacterium fluoranthenivorans]SCX32359.1 Predicted amidohydrolase [Mycolicibacterium fluoranthenivorans]
MTAPLPIALVQAPALPTRDLDRFAAGVRTLVAQRNGLRLLVYPELHLDTPVVEPGAAAVVPRDLAEPIDGPRGAALAALAGELGIWLVPGSVYELGDDGLVHNTAPVYSPAGERVAAYRKIAPWRPYETVTPGTDFVVFDIPGHGRVGLTICYDAWFPEIARQLTWLGADLILNVVQTPTVDREQEVVLARANAIVNQVFVASVNAAGPTGIGRSLLVDPEGRVRTQVPGAETAVLTDVLDLGEAARVRNHGTAGLNRLWEQFRPGDTPVALPLYGGKIDPETWGAGRGAADRSVTDAEGRS